ILDPERPVQPPLVAQRLNVLGGRALTEEGVDRIARSVERQGEGEKRPNEEGREEKHESTNDVAAQRSLPNRASAAGGSSQETASEHRYEVVAYPNTGHDACQSNGGAGTRSVRS